MDSNSIVIEYFNSQGLRSYRWITILISFLIFFQESQTQTQMREPIVRTISKQKKASQTSVLISPNEEELIFTEMIGNSKGNEFIDYESTASIDKLTLWISQYSFTILALQSQTTSGKQFLRHGLADQQNDEKNQLLFATQIQIQNLFDDPLRFITVYFDLEIEGLEFIQASGKSTQAGLRKSQQEKGFYVIGDLVSIKGFAEKELNAISFGFSNTINFPQHNGHFQNVLKTSQLSEFKMIELSNNSISQNPIGQQNLAHILRYAVELYKHNRENGEDQDSPQWDFPVDGSFKWIKGVPIEDSNNLFEYVQGKLEQQDGIELYIYDVIYHSGPKDKQWMAEKDQNFLERLEIESQPHIRSQNTETRIAPISSSQNESSSLIYNLPFDIQNKIDIRQYWQQLSFSNQFFRSFLKGQLQEFEEAPSENTPEYLIDHLLKTLRKQNNDSEGTKWGYSNNNVLHKGNWVLRSANDQNVIDHLVLEIKKLALTGRKSIDIMTLDKINPHSVLFGGVFLPLLLAEGEFEFIRDLKEPIIVRIFHGNQFNFSDRCMLGKDIVMRILQFKDQIHKNVEVIVASAFVFPFGWNHAKIIIIDGRISLVGGMNFKNGFYLISDYTVNDLFIAVEGKAAKDAQNFVNMHWNQYNDDKHSHVYYQEDGINWIRSIKEIQLLPFKKIQRCELIVGFLNENLKDRIFDKLDHPIANENQIGVSVFALGRQKGEKEPANVAIYELMRQAKKSLYISHQTLIGWGYWVQETMEEIAAALLRGVKVKILLSEADKNSYDLAETYKGVAARDVINVFKHKYGVPKEYLKNLRILNMQSFTAVTEKEKQDPPPYPRQNHAKVVIVDEIAAYAGSQNLYPTLIMHESEYGFLIIDEEGVKEFIELYWNPVWNECFNLKQQQIK